MPTRDRAYLLKTALASALLQTYDDLEIVVSDNYSTDDTKKIVDSFNNRKIRYIRTDRPLDMPKSWEFVLHHAQGEYITYLTDDSYLFPYAIERALTEMKRFNSRMAVWNMCTYFAPDWLEPGWRNYLIVPKTTFQSHLLSSEMILKKFYDLQDDLSCPKVLNTLFHRKIAEEVLKVQGKLFLPPSPDYTAAIGLLHNVKEYVFIDDPLFIDGKFPVSIGMISKFNWGKATQEYLAEFEDIDFTKAIDLNIPTLSVNMAQSLEMMRKYYPEILKYEINRENLICKCVNDLILHEINGVDVRESWRVLKAYQNMQPEKVRKAVRKQKVRSKIRIVLKKACVYVPFHEFLLKLIGGWQVFRGSRWGFSNLQQCGEVAPSLIEKMRKKSSGTLVSSLGQKK